jgi:hypothetical protein
VQGAGDLLNRIRTGGLSERLLDRLRAAHGATVGGVWSVAVECREPLTVPDEWYDEETIRGDVLRQFRELDRDGSLDLDLAEFLPESWRTGPYADLATVSAADRGDLLLAASKLGVELLAWDENEE